AVGGVRYRGGGPPRGGGPGCSSRSGRDFAIPLFARNAPMASPIRTLFPNRPLTCLSAVRPAEEGLHLAPQGEPLLPFLGRQLFQRDRFAQARQVRVVSPALQRPPSLAGRGGARERLVP